MTTMVLVMCKKTVSRGVTRFQLSTFRPVDFESCSRTLLNSSVTVGLCERVSEFVGSEFLRVCERATNNNNCLGKFSEVGHSNSTISYVLYV